MNHTPVWKDAPFLRITIPFIAGIAGQWYLQPDLRFSVAMAIAALIVIILVQWHRVNHFRFYWIRGVLLNVLLISIACVITYCHDDIHEKKSITALYKTGDFCMVKLEEPLSEKPNSFQARASVQWLVSNEKCLPANGNILLFIKKTSAHGDLPSLRYGDWIGFRKALQPILAAGNPGAFDYERYYRMQQIRFAVYLQKKDWVNLRIQTGGFWQKALIHTREKILHILRRFLPGRVESGLAEALLIGYRNDVDRDLSRDYSNTGVVHIIAISGLHLALIYGLLSFCLRPLHTHKNGRWLSLVILVISLWGFSLLCGATPSVLRSALMFTCIALGEAVSKKTSIYNSLAASAFLLLCYNPYWLWDPGFQLSYTAVLSIVVFMKPIYESFPCEGRVADSIWKSISVCLAAQILTTPICVFQFHQFPLYFLPANLVAVPLSSLILLGEILLCGISFIPIAARGLGYGLSWLIWLLNHYIGFISHLPCSTWGGLEISAAQCWLLYVFIAGATSWHFLQNKKWLTCSLLALVGFMALRSISFWRAMNQKELIVFNLPHGQVIDCVWGRKYFVQSDSLASNPLIQNTCCGATRTLLRTCPAGPVPEIDGLGSFFSWRRNRILILSRRWKAMNTANRIHVDCIVIAHNLPVSMKYIVRFFDCDHYVFDASNRPGRVANWQKECEQLKIHGYAVAERGAFVMNMD